jgi:hypothetical protein
LILSPNVAAPLLEALKNTSELLFGIFLSLNHTMYTFSPEIVIGAAWKTLRFAFEPSICACVIGFTVSVAAITRAINTTMPKTRILINELDRMRSLVYCYRFEIALVWKHFGYLLSNAVHNTIYLLLFTLS